MLSQVQYDELLLDIWKDVPVRDRPEALRRAFRAGQYCAEYALCEDGGEDVLYETDQEDLLRCFFEHFIEYFSYNYSNHYVPPERMLDLYQSLYWDSISDENRITADPRLKPFCDGWLKFIAEERARRH